MGRSASGGDGDCPPLWLPLTVGTWPVLPPLCPGNAVLSMYEQVADAPNEHFLRPSGSRAAQSSDKSCTSQAQASQTVIQEAGQSVEDLDKYWTLERMRSARPEPMTAEELGKSRNC